MTKKQFVQQFKSNELAEEAWEKWVAKIIEQSAEKYFSMPNEVFNNTKCQDNIIK